MLPCYARLSAQNNDIVDGIHFHRARRWGGTPPLSSKYVQLSHLEQASVLVEAYHTAQGKSEVVVT